MMNWLKDHWFLPLAAIVAALVWLWSRGKRPGAAAAVAVEIEAARAASNARKLEALVGAREAVDTVLKVHAAEVQRLSDAQVSQAEELRHDPAALSRFLVRAGRSR